MQRLLTAFVLCAALVLVACGDQKTAAPAVAVADTAKAQSDAAAKAAADGKVKQQVQAAIDAYVYGYSLITTDVTRIQMSNVPKQEGLRSPMGQFLNVP